MFFWFTPRIRLHLVYDLRTATRHKHLYTKDTYLQNGSKGVITLYIYFMGVAHHVILICIVYWYSIYNTEFRPVGMMGICIALTSIKVHKIQMVFVFIYARAVEGLVRNQFKRYTHKWYFKVTRSNTGHKAELSKIICTN